MTKLNTYLKGYERNNNQADHPRIANMPGFEIFPLNRVEGGVNNTLNEADEYQQSTVGHYLQLKKHIHQIRVTPRQWYGLRKQGNSCRTYCFLSLHSFFV
jgi:hypothetical protein